MHSDFEKILGEMTRPSTSVVFGEKGSGKTAIRCRSRSASRSSTRGTRTRRSSSINYDDLNQPVAELDARFGSAKDPLAPFKAFRLVDHMDAVLAIATDRIVAALFNEGEDRPAADLGAEPGRSARPLGGAARHDLLLLQALYDPADIDGERRHGCGGCCGSRRRRARCSGRAGGCRGLGPAAAALFLWLFPMQTVRRVHARRWSACWLLLLVGYLGVLVKRLVWDRMAPASARRARSRRDAAMPADRDAIAGSLAHLDPATAGTPRCCRCTRTRTSRGTRSLERCGA
jgi:hypothetical protein